MRIEIQGFRFQVSGFRFKRVAFTLIEMLVVIAIIGILAGLVLGVYPSIQERKIRDRVKAERSAVETAIESYKEKKGFYPPDNLMRADRPPLYYELTGNSITNDVQNPPQVQTLAESMGITNVVNFAAEDSRNYYPNLRPAQIAEVDAAGKIIPPGTAAPGTGIRFLGVKTTAPDGTPFVVWQYDAHSDNRHNHESFDLWVEVKIGSKTHTLGNWND